jgi:hypothetical protein
VRFYAAKVAGKGIALKDIARVHDHNRARVHRLERVHDRRDSGQSPGKRLVAGVVPIGRMAVHVRRRHQDHVGRVLDQSRAKPKRCQNVKHWGLNKGGRAAKAVEADPSKAIQYQNARNRYFVVTKKAGAKRVLSGIYKLPNL